MFKNIIDRVINRAFNKSRFVDFGNKIKNADLIIIGRYMK